MSKPYIHAKSSARRFGGKPEDYEEIHNLMDSSKASFPLNSHRCLTHQSWFISVILERIKFHNSAPCTPDNRFPLIINSDGKEVSVRDIGEQHILEDFKGRFIPTVADYLNNLEFQPWMQNGDGVPPSFQKIYDSKKKKAATPKDMVFDSSMLLPSPSDMVIDGLVPVVDQPIPPDILSKLKD